MFFFWFTIGLLGSVVTCLGSVFFIFSYIEAFLAVKVHNKTLEHAEFYAVAREATTLPPARDESLCKIVRFDGGVTGEAMDCRVVMFSNTVYFYQVDKMDELHDHRQVVREEHLIGRVNFSCVSATAVHISKYHRHRNKDSRYASIRGKCTVLTCKDGHPLFMEDPKQRLLLQLTRMRQDQARRESTYQVARALGSTSGSFASAGTTCSEAVLHAAEMRGTGAQGATQTHVAAHVDEGCRDVPCPVNSRGHTQHMKGAHVRHGQQTRASPVPLRSSFPSCATCEGVVSGGSALPAAPPTTHTRRSLMLAEVNESSRRRALGVEETGRERENVVDRRTVTTMCPHDGGGEDVTTCSSKDELYYIVRDDNAVVRGAVHRRDAMTVFSSSSSSSSAASAAAAAPGAKNDLSVAHATSGDADDDATATQACVCGGSSAIYAKEESSSVAEQTGLNDKELTEGADVNSEDEDDDDESDVPVSQWRMMAIKFPSRRVQERWLTLLQGSAQTTQWRDYIRHLPKVDAFNLLVARLFFENTRTNTLQELFESKMREKLAHISANLPKQFCGTITLERLVIGGEIPLISHVSEGVVWPNGDIEFDFDVLYRGGLMLSIRFDIKYRRIQLPTVIFHVKLLELSGRMRFNIAPPPTRKFWLSGSKPPQLRLELTQEVTNKESFLGVLASMIPNLSKIATNVVKVLLFEDMVLPNFDDFPWPVLDSCSSDVDSDERSDEEQEEAAEDSVVRGGAAFKHARRQTDAKDTSGGIAGDVVDSVVEGSLDSHGSPYRLPCAIATMTSTSTPSTSCEEHVRPRRTGLQYNSEANAQGATTPARPHTPAARVASSPLLLAGRKDLQRSADATLSTTKGVLAGVRRRWRQARLLHTNSPTRTGGCAEPSAPEKVLGSGGTPLVRDDAASAVPMQPQPQQPLPAGRPNVATSDGLVWTPMTTREYTDSPQSTPPIDFDSIHNKANKIQTYDESVSHNNDNNNNNNNNSDDNDNMDGLVGCRPPSHCSAALGGGVAHGRTVREEEVEPSRRLSTSSSSATPTSRSVCVISAKDFDMSEYDCVDAAGQPYRAETVQAEEEGDAGTTQRLLGAPRYRLTEAAQMQPWLNLEKDLMLAHVDQIS